MSSSILAAASGASQQDYSGEAMAQIVAQLPAAQQQTAARLGASLRAYVRGNAKTDAEITANKFERKITALRPGEPRCDKLPKASWSVGTCKWLSAWMENKLGGHGSQFVEWVKTRNAIGHNVFAQRLNNLLVFAQKAGSPTHTVEQAREYASLVKMQVEEIVKDCEWAKCSEVNGGAIAPATLFEMGAAAFDDMKYDLITLSYIYNTLNNIRTDNLLTNEGPWSQDGECMKCLNVLLDHLRGLPGIGPSAGVGELAIPDSENDESNSDSPQLNNQLGFPAPSNKSGDNNEFELSLVGSIAENNRFMGEPENLNQLGEGNSPSRRVSEESKGDEPQGDESNSYNKRIHDLFALPEPGNNSSGTKTAPPPMVDINKPKPAKSDLPKTIEHWEAHNRARRPQTAAAYFTKFDEVLHEAITSDMVLLRTARNQRFKEANAIAIKSGSHEPPPASFGDDEEAIELNRCKMELKNNEGAWANVKWEFNKFIEGKGNPNISRVCTQLLANHDKIVELRKQQNRAELALENIPQLEKMSDDAKRKLLMKWPSYFDNTNPEELQQQINMAKSQIKNIVQETSQIYERIFKALGEKV